MNTTEIDPFWKRVKTLIRAHKISQEEFASYIGISFNTLKTWFRNNRIPDAYTAHDIAVALGVSVEYLVTGEDRKALEEREKQTLLRKTAALDIEKMAVMIKKNAKLIG